MLTRRDVVSRGVNLADRWLEDYSLGATGQGLGCECEKWAQKGGLGSFAMFSTSDREQKGCVFQDDVLVSGLKMTPPACCGGLCLSSPGGRRKANEEPTGVASESPAAACPKSALRARVSGRRFRTRAKAWEAAWMGLIGASRLVCRIQRRITSTSIRKSERRISNKGAMIYACRAPVLSI
jgi:hypothetical protein